MAQPVNFPDWAEDNTNLPSTGQANKVRPKTSLRTIGWDKGELPTAEEWNWQLNNISLWIKYFQEFSSTTVPNLYLPKTGTQLNFTGDISGTATWNGNNTASVMLSSATLTSATPFATANTLAKRDGAGSVFFAGVAATSLSVTGGSATVGDISTSSAQGTTAGSLTRKDYVDNIQLTLQNNINSVQADLNNFKNTVAATYITAVRLGSRGTFGVDTGIADAPNGSVLVGGGDFGADDGAYAYRPLQYLINGTWYTASIV